MRYLQCDLGFCPWRQTFRKREEKDEQFRKDTWNPLGVILDSNAKHNEDVKSHGHGFHGGQVPSVNQSKCATKVGFSISFQSDTRWLAGFLFSLSLHRTSKAASNLDDGKGGGNKSLK